MALQQHALFGAMYLDPEQFVANASMFGVSESDLPPNVNGVREELMSVLAAASRWVDARTHKSYIPDLDHVEQHTLDPQTGRIWVNNPPILSISDFRILTGATSFTSVASSSLFINNQQTWVEMLMQPFFFPMLSEVFIRITYKSVSDVPQNIRLATGYIAATMINDSSFNSKMPSGVKSIKIGSQAQITRLDSKVIDGGSIDLSMPPIVGHLLSNEVAIGIA